MLFMNLCNLREIAYSCSDASRFDHIIMTTVTGSILQDGLLPIWLAAMEPNIHVVKELLSDLVQQQLSYQNKARSYRTTLYASLICLTFTVCISATKRGHLDAFCVAPQGDRHT